MRLIYTTKASIALLPTSRSLTLSVTVVHNATQSVWCFTSRTTIVPCEWLAFVTKYDIIKASRTQISHLPSTPAARQEVEYHAWNGLERSRSTCLCPTGNNHGWWFVCYLIKHGMLSEHAQKAIATGWWQMNSPDPRYFDRVPFW